MLLGEIKAERGKYESTYFKLGHGKQDGSGSFRVTKVHDGYTRGGVYRSEPAVKNAGRGGSLRDYYNDRLV